MSRTKRFKDTSNKWVGANETGRDKKPSYNPDSSFKKFRRKQYRAKSNKALLTGHELPQERKTNVWDWN